MGRHGEHPRPWPGGSACPEPGAAGSACPGGRPPGTPACSQVATASSRQRRVTGNAMKEVLNVVWLILCGIWMSIAYVVAGLVCFLLFFLIITIPFGIAAFRIANYVLWPFGRTIEAKRDAGMGSLIGNIIWIVVAGWWLATTKIGRGHVLTPVTLESRIPPSACKQNKRNST